jgi:hypothetical protein
MGLKEAKLVEGFDPDNKFTTHMQLVGYSSQFIRVEQFQEGGRDNLDLKELGAYQNSNNSGELNSINEVYKQHDKETKNQNPKSPATSQRNTLSIMKRRTIGMDTRKTPVRGSNNGGDKNPPRKSLDKAHVAYTLIKRKINKCIKSIGNSLCDGHG